MIQDWAFELRLIALPLNALEKGEVPANELKHELDLTEITVRGAEVRITMLCTTAWLSPTRSASA